jgi:HPt (histidine-containing phosphotransfer) domain-containing protein
MSDEPTRPPEPDAQAPVRLDPRALDQLRGLDPDGTRGVVERVLGAFESSLARILGQRETMRPDPDVTVLHRLAHTLKSSAGNVGAQPLSQAGAHVEWRLRRGHLDRLDEDIEFLLTHGRAALLAVRAMLHP